MQHTRLGSPLLALFGVALLVAGCGPGKGAPVSAKVVLPPGLSLANNDQIEVTLVPDDPKVKRGASGRAEGTDKATEVVVSAINTSETTGVLPGKYKVAVRVTPYAGGQGSENRKRAFEDTINKKFATDTTPLTYEVTGDTNNISIDLGKRTVTKN